MLRQAIVTTVLAAAPSLSMDGQAVTGQRGPVSHEASTPAGRVSHTGTTMDTLQEVDAFEARANRSNPPEAIFEAIGVKPGMVVAEIGARHGRIAIPLARRVGPAGKVYANDIDREALALLRDRCVREKVGNLETVLGKADDPLLPKGALDLALFVWTYHEVSQPRALLKNVSPALKPGARVVLVEPRVVTRAAVEADGAAAGLELVEVKGDVVARDDVFILRKK